jgi:hypothetical protein
MCDKEVSIDEIFNAAKLQKPDKSPGDDSISSEFYQLFWYLIGDDFVSVVKDIFAINACVNLNTGVSLHFCLKRENGKIFGTGDLSLY